MLIGNLLLLSFSAERTNSANPIPHDWSALWHSLLIVSFHTEWSLEGGGGGWNLRAILKCFGEGLPFPGKCWAFGSLLSHPSVPYWFGSGRVGESFPVNRCGKPDFSVLGQEGLPSLKSFSRVACWQPFWRVKEVYLSTEWAGWNQAAIFDHLLQHMGIKRLGLRSNIFQKKWASKTCTLNVYGLKIKTLGCNSGYLV